MCASDGEVAPHIMFLLANIYALFSGAMLRM